MRSKSAVWFALAVLFAINTLNFFDRLIIGAVGEPIRREFGLSDASLGLLGTAFTLLYAFVGIPFGRLADRAQRKWILSAGVFVWSLLTAGTGIAQNYVQMFAMRLGVGVGEASCAPAATSLIGDMFPPEKRGRAMSVFMLGLPIGIALSFAVSGAVAQAYGWRAAFFVAAIPGVLVAALALLIREPSRGESESDGIGKTRRTGSPYRLILSSRTMRWLILSGAVHNFCLFALSSFMTPFLMRFHGLEIREASLVAMTVNGILTLPGLLLGGWVSDAARKWRPNGPLLVVTLAILLSVPFFVLATNASAGHYYAFLGFMGAAYALMYFYYSTVYATIADVTEPSLRGTAMSIYFMAMYLLGGAFGPYAVGAISDLFTKRAAALAGAADGAASLEPFRGVGLQTAMYIVPLLVLGLAAILFMASRSVSAEVDEMQAWMRESADPEL